MTIFCRAAVAVLLAATLFQPAPAAAEAPACAATPTRACILAHALTLARTTPDTLERGLNLLAIADATKRSELVDAARAVRATMSHRWSHAQLGREIARVQAVLGRKAEALATTGTILDPRVRTEALVDVAAATGDATLLARARAIAMTIRARDWESLHQRRNALDAIAKQAAAMGRADEAMEICRQVRAELNYDSCYEDILGLFADAKNFADAWRALEPLTAEYARNAGLALIAHATIDAGRIDEAREIAGRITYLTTRSYVLAHIAAEAKDLPRLREISMAVYEAYHKPNTDNPHHGAYMIRIGRYIARAGFDDEAMKYASYDAIRPYILLGLIDNRIARGAWAEAAAFLAQIPHDGWSEQKFGLARTIATAQAKAGDTAAALRTARAAVSAAHYVPVLMAIYEVLGEP